MSDAWFIAYKAFSLFLMPLGFTLTGWLVAVVLLSRRRRKAALILSVTMLVWLWWWSTPVWSDRIRNALESRFPYLEPSSLPEADAIVVLGGGIRGYAGEGIPELDLNRAADREFYASLIYKAQKGGRIILSGGADPVQRTGVSASAMKLFLINLGVPADSILVGTNSRNTLENRSEVAGIMDSIGGHSIILVTSALHMQRAYWLFSRTALKVYPAPTDMEVVENPFSLYRLIPDAEALENSTRAMRELLGLWAYRLAVD